MTTSTTWRSPIDLTFHLEACQYVVRTAKVFLAPNLQPATIDYTLSGSWQSVAYMQHKTPPTACFGRLGTQHNGIAFLHDDGHGDMA